MKTKILLKDKDCCCDPEQLKRDIDRIRKSGALDGPFYEMPQGLSRKEMWEWMENLANDETKHEG